MHGRAHSCAEVSGARCDVTKMFIVSELGDGLDVSSGTGETLEDLEDVGALLHGNDAELVLFVDPDEESLGVVVEDTTTTRPIAVQARSLQEAIAFLEEEVVSNKLLLVLLAHALERVERALEVTFKSVAGLNDLVHNIDALFLSDTGTERESSKIATNSNSGRKDHTSTILGEWLNSLSERVGIHV